MSIVDECKLCGENSRLVNSHVIPQALHADIQSEIETGETMEIHSDRRNYSMRSRTGAYGQFLCRDCEDIFHAWDEEGIRFVRRYRDGTEGERFQQGDHSGFTAEVDYTKFKPWIMSLLWRANECKHELFKRVSLGDKWTAELSQKLIDNDTGGDKDFTVSGSWFDHRDFRQTLLDPHQERIEGVNHYRFYMYGGFTFLIKVDQRKSTLPSSMLLSTNGKLRIINRQPSQGEVKAMRQILR